MSMLRNRWLLAGAAVVAALVVLALWPSAMEVDAAKVERGLMRVTVDEEGETRVRDRFVVSAPVMGRVDRIELEPGDAVVRGKTVVATLTPASSPLIDPRTQAELTAGVDAARAVVGQSQAELQRAIAGRDRARSTVKRLEALLKSGAISGDELEAAQTTQKSGEEAVRVAEFALIRAQYDLQLARARLNPPRAGGSPVTVIAPVDGVVLKRLRESATVVPSGDPLLEIGDPGRLEIISDLLSTDAVRVSPGNAVFVDQWGGPQPLRGRVRRVEPSGFTKVSALGVEEQRVNVVIDFNDETESASLGDGYRVEVRIVIWSADAAIKVPAGCLFRRGSEWAVFVIENGRAELRNVKIGRRNDQEAEGTRRPVGRTIRRAASAGHARRWRPYRDPTGTAVNGRFVRAIRRLPAVPDWTPELP